MVLVFNLAEFAFFLIGIMAQRGPAYLRKLQKIKEDLAEQKVVGEGSAPDATPFPDQAPPPDSGKRKCKEKKEKPKDDKRANDKKASSSQPSTKRSWLSVPEQVKTLLRPIRS